MGYSLKEDWNQLKQNMADLHVKMQYSDVCQAWNQEMTDVVNTYKKELTAWYSVPHFTENAFQTTTQNLWYAHYLNKIRLRTLGLTAKYDYIQPTEYVRSENQRYPHWSYSHDGKNLLCKISDTMHYRKSFFDENRLIWSDEGGGLPGEYYIIQARSIRGSYICPNCGREDTLEHLVDGCDYCGTKFQIEDFDQKVSSVYNPGSRTQQRSGFTLLKNFWPLYIILLLIAIGGMFMMGLLTSGADYFRDNPDIMPNVLEKSGVWGHLGLLLVPAGMVLLLIVFLAVLLGKTTKESVKEGPARSRQTLTRLRNVDKYFSEEAFIGNLSNKLMSLCYAESMEEVRPFAECDMTPFLQRYQNVIDCKMLECVWMDYQVREGYQYLAVQVRLGLVLYENERVGKTTVQMKLGLLKSMNALTQSINDVKVYHCASCGRSLSLLNGGRCEYCGTMLDLKAYDWVIGRCEWSQS